MALAGRRVRVSRQSPTPALLVHSRSGSRSLPAKTTWEWLASETPARESSGNPPSGAALISAVPAKFARSRLVVRGTTRTDWSTLVKWSLCQITTGLRPRLLTKSIGTEVGPPDLSTLHPRSAESSECAHSARPSSDNARSSSGEILARGAKFQRRGSGRRITIRLTRSPGRRAKCSTGRRTPFSYSASTSLTAIIVTLAFGGKMPACNSVQGSTAFLASLALRAI